MLEIKTMPLKEFLKTASQADEELLNKMYKRICENRKNRSTFLDCADMPFYTSSDGSVYGGGECNDILSHRNGYGFTMISVGDRGSWICSVHCKSKRSNDIAFFDGEFDEVYQQLIEYYGGEREQD